MRTITRRFSEASSMTAPPVQDLAGAFQTMVVSEASRSPATFSRTIPSPPKQRTSSRPPSAPLPSQWQGGLLGLGAVHREGEAPLGVEQQPAPGGRDARPAR
jgi:hypothetical protein